MSKKLIEKMKSQIINDESILDAILIMWRMQDLTKTQDNGHKDHIHNLIKKTSNWRKIDEIFINSTYSYYDICKQMFK